MARGNDRGKDFDDQWHASRRAGQYKASRGEGPWANDKYLQRLDARLSKPQAHHAKSDSCWSATAILMGLLAGLGWLADAAVRYVA